MKPCIYGDCSTPWPSTRHYTPAEYDAIVESGRQYRNQHALDSSRWEDDGGRVIPEPMKGLRY